MRSGVHARRGTADPLLARRRRRLARSASRPPEWVLDDVIDGFVSIEKARELYGVEVRIVDEDAASTKSTPRRRRSSGRPDVGPVAS